MAHGQGLPANPDPMPVEFAHFGTAPALAQQDDAALIMVQQFGRLPLPAKPFTLLVAAVSGWRNPTGWHLAGIAEQIANHTARNSCVRTTIVISHLYEPCHLRR